MKPIRWDRHEWHERFTDLLERQPVRTNVVASAGTLVAGTALQSLWAANPRSPSGWWMLWTLILIGCVVASALATERTKSVATRRWQIRSVRKMVEMAAENAGDRKKHHLRANVMLPTEDRRHRKVDALTAFNMGDDGDCDLEVPLVSGVSGAAWQKRAGKIGDLTQVTLANGPDWGLSPAQQKKVRQGLKSILSVPIPDPTSVDGEPLGTLQVDSDSTVDELGWNGETVDRVQRIADVIALHMGLNV